MELRNKLVLLVSVVDIEVEPFVKLKKHTSGEKEGETEAAIFT